jgi:hypothetical protein
MSYALVADLVVALHLAFVLFAVAGGFLVWRYPRLAWLHLPALLWAVGIELSGGICPLTPLENRLRAMAGEDGYAGGFVEHYVLPVLYPAGLTREAQLALGLGLAGLNAFVYARLLRRAGRGRAV